MRPVKAVMVRQYDEGFLAHPDVNIAREERISLQYEPNYDDDNDASDDTEGDAEEEVNDDLKIVRETDKEIDLTAQMPYSAIFEDFDQYETSHWMSVLTPSYYKPSEPPTLRTYTKLYTNNPLKAYVPMLKKNIQLSLSSFTDVFRKKAMPIKFSFESLRKSGFRTRSHSLEDLRKMFPYNGEVGKVFTQYKPNRAYSGAGEVDLGPGLADIQRDANLSKKPHLRSFPRNMKVKSSDVARLDIDTPKLIDSRYFQKPTLWMGTSSSGTALHSDCCDNFVMMISGTKRFTLAPPTDFYELSPRCVGKSKGLCYGTPSEPVSDMKYSWNKIVVDVGPGEILYMPSNWFHHVENVGPTVMVNIWTRRGETHGVVSCNQ